MKCPRCDGAIEPGTLVTFARVDWAKSPRTLVPSGLIQHARGQRFSRAACVPAARCVRCACCVFNTNASCAHDFQNGWILPYSALWWLPAGVAFEPSFWWPLNRRLRSGHTPELLYAPGFRLTLASGRRAGMRCRHCEAAAVFYAQSNADHA